MQLFLFVMGAQDIYTIHNFYSTVKNKMQQERNLLYLGLRHALANIKKKMGNFVHSLSSSVGKCFFKTSSVLLKSVSIKSLHMLKLGWLSGSLDLNLRWKTVTIWCAIAGQRLLRFLHEAGNNFSKSDDIWKCRIKFSIHKEWIGYTCITCDFYTNLVYKQIFLVDITHSFNFLRDINFINICMPLSCRTALSKQQIGANQEYTGNMGNTTTGMSIHGEHYDRDAHWEYLEPPRHHFFQPWWGCTDEHSSDEIFISGTEDQKPAPLRDPYWAWLSDSVWTGLIPSGCPTTNWKHGSRPDSRNNRVDR